MPTPGTSSRSLGFLGPAGTFTEEALVTRKNLAEMRRQPFNSMMQVLKAVESGRVDLGFVPIENMIEGAVTSSIDTLAFGTGLLIQYEVTMDVRLTLMALPGADLDSVKYLRSYPVAYAQCSRYLTRRLPDVVMIAANSTAAAARDLATRGDLDTVVIAPRRAADVYGLEVLAVDIEDQPGNKTRFLLVGRDTVPPPTGRDKTSLVVYQRADAPGSLVGILGEFVARSINITSLQSRPTKAGLGSYCFLIDCEGHIMDERLGDALRNLQMRAASVKFLGSYPADSVSHVRGPANRAAREDVDASYVDDEGYLLLAGVPDQTSRDQADAWLADVRSRVV
ncbi:MAG: prephenate dehydratase [bacterium]|nr:prephenate dehydratase [bacterium]